MSFSITISVHNALQLLDQIRCALASAPGADRGCNFNGNDIGAVDVSAKSLYLILACLKFAKKGGANQCRCFPAVFTAREWACDS
jgi:hypothetical protein